jgi:Helicase HerA, central domain
VAQGLYLGKQVDAASGALGARLDLDPTDLLTHGLIVGMTGSGKTGLAIALIEELLRQGVPVLAIDPKGDLGNLLLLFDDLQPASFQPWIDADSAARAGQTVEAAAQATAAAWQKGLAEWGLGAADVAGLRARRDAVIYTPGSSAGVGLNILQSLEVPAGGFAGAEEDLRDEIASIASGLLALVGIEADPLQSQEAILLANLIEHAWRAGRGLTLEALVTGIADPPFDKLGALPLESVYPRKERTALMMRLNNLLASPTFEAWRSGEPLDIERMLRAPDGRPRLSVVYTAHLSDAERLFVTALLLEKVKTWMRRQGGTTALRAVVYMDEIFGYFPPHPANPPTKKPLLTLLKQARAQGVSIVLATQNPVDLDYKGLSNIGTWLVGKLQTEQDRARLMDGLVGAGVAAEAVTTLLKATKQRVFLLHDVHRSAACLLHSRWAMSYLRGPLTRDEIERLMAGKATTAAAAGSSAQAAAPALPPVLPSPLRSLYFKQYGGELADAYVLVKYAVRYKDTGENTAMRAYTLAVDAVAEILESDPLTIDEQSLADEAPAGVRYGDLPAWLQSSGTKGLEKTLRDRLPDKLAVSLWTDPKTKATSSPGETRDAFAQRLSTGGGGPAAQKLRDKIEKLQRDIALKEQELSGRKQETWAAVGTAILSNIGLFTGRKKTISGAGSVLSKNRMENTLEAKLEALKADLAETASELQQQGDVDAGRLQELSLVPAKTAVKILRYEIVWVY